MGRPWRGGFWIALAAAVIRPLSCLLTRRRWSGQGNIPASGGVILVANHLSTVDPPLLAHYVYAAGRSPRFMAKSDLWEVPILRRVLAGAGQIPVYRRDPSAGGALRDAVAALRAGRALVIYPEGGITTDPDYWPMRARTGVARLALATGAPVIPVAQWGAQRIWGRDRRPHLFARPEIRVHAGRPVDLSRFAARSGAPTDPSGVADPSGAWLLRAVTDVVMADLTAVVELVRGEPAPPPAGSAVPADPVPPAGSAEPGPEIPCQPEAAASPGARPPDPDAPRAGSAR
ncbi:MULTISPECIES: 1-acyl-sn-glycerol-3-phosphate acyltransferase [Parafrankia]|uniref:Glycerol acyltransferase n=1 Tax=Parafrankia soli TaxID=2599596 RepID=A0A1S1R0K6_9ACTN|nr:MULTISPECIES: lysophospholipid acyltransferase family protein [Parafrankia]OHV40473.1 glycerol acyltransferase [Parafrankia soli]TCJ36430.1 1-acyl-sn-glycerol-3-phosphate acyltransferase [Parafrankia sp. BMG5.11]CAI7980411.1 1-acyl-sn-glycerol-3-phosphate acyltransferase [Frankia sp. Hr75.2]SQD94602.1 Phospholipid/glycerol acyltransferase [Parafrankia sp. Ea1.12]